MILISGSCDHVWSETEASPERRCSRLGRVLMLDKESPPSRERCSFGSALAGAEARRVAGAEAGQPGYPYSVWMTL